MNVPSDVFPPFSLWDGNKLSVSPSMHLHFSFTPQLLLFPFQNKFKPFPRHPSTPDSFGYL